MVRYQILCETQQICDREFALLTEAYGDATLPRTMVFKWHKAFKEGRENVGRRPSFWKTNQSRQQMIKMWKWCEL